MIITRYINGVEVEESEIKNYKLSDPKIQEIVDRVVSRVNEQAERSRKEVA